MSFQLNLKQMLPVLIVSILMAFTITETVKAETAHFAENEISGAVTDASTGEALADAEVIIIETGESTVSDADGNFYFSGLEAGTYTVEVNLEGYESASESVEVTEEGATLEITLTPSER